MIKREIKIALASNPTTGVGFKIRFDFTSELETSLKQFTFVGGAVSDPAGIYISSNVSFAQTKINLFNNATLRYASYPFVTVVQNADGISIFAELESVSSSTVENNYPEYFTITHTSTAVIDPTPVAPEVILSRSPYFVNISPSGNFDSAVMDLRIYTGDIIADYPTLPNYSLSKPVVQAGQDTIIFDIYKLVNNFVKANIGVFAGAGSFTTSTKESVWVEATITAYYQGETVGATLRKYLAVDGFGWHTEMANPMLGRKVLSSITNHLFYIGSDYPLYFVTKGLQSITINETDVPFTFNQDFSNQVIGYVNPSAYAVGAGFFTAEFEYESETVMHAFEVREECKYGVVNCFFKNKFGYWQTISFPKLSRSGYEMENNNYHANISTFGNYDLATHVEKTFMPTLKEKRTLNTDFIPESQNDLFKEFLLSEFVYLEEDGVILPATLVTKSFEKKTKINDKLVKYTMDFRYAFNLMNVIT